MACSSPSSSPAPSAETDAAQTDDCERYAAAICSNYELDCGWSLRVFHPDAATCRTEALRGCREQLSLPGLVDPGNHEPCLTAMEKAECGFPIPECRSKPGTLPDGEPCEIGGQCTSAFCKFGESACGTCAPRPTAGAPCESAFECMGGEPALICDSGKCVAPPKLGEPCLNFSCGANQSCVDGVCVRSANEGEACRTSTPSLPDCVDGLACSGTCVKYQAVELGAPCDGAHQCRGAAACNGGKCVAKQPIGGACTKSIDCAWWAACYGGKCEGFSVCHR